MLVTIQVVQCMVKTARNVGDHSDGFSIASEYPLGMLSRLSVRFARSMEEMETDAISL
jgi:hypothetical protein